MVLLPEPFSPKKTIDDARFDSNEILFKMKLFPNFFVRHFISKETGKFLKLFIHKSFHNTSVRVFDEC